MYNKFVTNEKGQFTNSLVESSYMDATVGKWGNSLALRIPQQIAAQLGVTENSSVSLKVEGNCLVVEKEYSLEELCSQITDGNRHELVDFGPPVGKEII